MVEPMDYCALICREPDRLRIVNSHDEVVEVVRNAFAEAGVEAEYYAKSQGSSAFKISGFPFVRRSWDSEEKSIKISRTLALVVERLQGLSWSLVTSTDVAKKNTNSCLFFRKIKMETPSSNGKIFTFAPSSNSDILLVDIPRDIETQIVQAVRDTHGVDSHKITEDDGGSHVTSKISLEGWFNWHATGDQAISLRKMLMEVIQVARKHKYDLICNLNTKGTTDSLMFQHNPNLSEFRQEDMFIMSLNRNDRIRLISAPDYIVTSTADVVTSSWDKGIQENEAKEGFHELKLRGTPWWADGESAIKSRFLIINMIAKFQALGWEVAATLDVSRRLKDKTMFVFRHNLKPVDASSPEVKWAVLSFHESDKLRFMSNSNNDTVFEGINKILDASEQIQRGPEDYWKAKQWKLKGNPFYGMRGWWGGMDLRLMVHHLTKILKLFHSEGWRLVASADVSAKMHHGHTNQHHHEESYPLDTHSWFFLHDPDTKQEISMDSLTDQTAVGEIRSEGHCC